MADRFEIGQAIIARDAGEVRVRCSALPAPIRIDPYPVPRPHLRGVRDSAAVLRSGTPSIGKDRRGVEHKNITGIEASCLRAVWY